MRGKTGGLRGVPKKGGLGVPRDFVRAQQALHSLIDDYTAIAPDMPLLKERSLRERIILALQERSFPTVRAIASENKLRFSQEIMAPGLKDSMLVFFSASGNFEAVEFLLVNKVDPNQTDDSGQTAVHTAVKGDFQQVLGLLRQFQACFWLVNKAGDSPFRLAADIGSERILRQLVEYGADPFIIDVTGKPEVAYIEDLKLRGKIIQQAYWLRRKFFVFLTSRAALSRLSTNLKALIVLYI